MLRIDWRPGCPGMPMSTPVGAVARTGTLDRAFEAVVLDACTPPGPPGSVISEPNVVLPPAMPAPADAAPPAPTVIVTDDGRSLAAKKFLPHDPAEPPEPPP